MIDYVELLQDEINTVKRKSIMADNVMNFNGPHMGQCRRNNFAHFNTDDTLDELTQVDISYKIKNKEGDLRKKKIKQHVNYFIENSTLHGFHYCFDKKHKFRRLVWIILVLLSIGFLLEKVYGSAVKFFHYPFSTTTTLNYLDEIEFPAVSICNMNDFRASRYDPVQMNNESLDGEQYAALGNYAYHNLSDMLQDCRSPLNKTCNFKEFSSFNQLQGEKCYTFNLGNMGTNDTIIKVNKTGMEAAFEIVINVEQYDYDENVTLTSGVRLILHDQNETPTRMQGIALPPGYTSWVQIKKIKTTNLPSPFKTKCGFRKLKYFDHYSENTCYIERLTDYVVNKCNCKDSFMPGKAKPCSLAELKNCTWNRWEEFKKIKDIDCPIACEITQFEPILSFSQYPANKIADKMATRMNLTGSAQENRRFIRDNFLRVVIYYQHLSYTHLKQTPSYDLMIFLGDLGGQLGLFLGTSILTYVEFFDILIMVIYTKYFEIFKLRTKH